MKTTAPRAIIGCILFLTACALYLETLSFDFAYDDTALITLNPQVTAPSTTTIEIFTEPTHPGNLYRPLSTLSYRWTYLLFGLTPYWFHLTNVVLYSALVVLAFILVLEVTESLPIAAVSIFYFAIHPIHVEVVANIIGRSEILAGIFGIGSILCVLRWRRAPQGGKPLNLVAAVLLFFAATLSKESALTFLPLCALCLWTYERRHERPGISRATVVALGLLLIPAIGGLALRSVALGHQFLIASDGQTSYVENPLFHLNFVNRLYPALTILGSYLEDLFVPLYLSADYSMRPVDLLAEAFSFVGLFRVCLLIAVVIMAYRAEKDVRAFGWWFFVAFLLTANLLTPIGTIKGDRLAFIPSLGFCVLISATITSVIPMHRIMIRWPAAIIWAHLLLLMTLDRIPVWRNNGTLFSRTVADAPLSPKSRYNYALYLWKGQRRYDEAELFFKDTLRYVPNHTLSMVCLADMALERQQYWKVEYWDRRLLQIDPQNQKVKAQLEELQRYKEKL